MKSIAKISIIIMTLLLMSSFLTGQANDIDTTQVGVEVGDWFVHQVVQGDDSWMGFLEEGETQVGDQIKTIVTGFVENNVTIKTELNGESTSHSMGMDLRTSSYILFTDWKYWNWSINASWGPTHDALNNHSFLEENGISEGYRNYSILTEDITFNTTAEMYIMWDDNTMLFHEQIINYIKDSGVVSYVFVNSTVIEADGSIDQYIQESILVSSGHTDLNSSSDDTPLMLTYSIITILISISISRGRKGGKHI